MPRGEYNRTANATKQTYQVTGGMLEIKLSTEQPRSLDETDSLRAIFAAAEAYRAAHPPESIEVREERAAQRARLEEWEDK
jgi:hypothetical protein